MRRHSQVFKGHCVHYQIDLEAIVDAQQERVNRMEVLREALVKLRYKKRSRERFESDCREVHQTYLRSL